MNIRRLRFSVVATLAFALGVAGCADRDGVPVSPEADDPYFIQGMSLKRQGRSAEALNAFLKAIDRRGENPSPESHLEAGLIHLYQTKDYLAACYHLRRYYKTQPNSKEAPYVLGKIEEAKREFVRTLPGRPMDDQSVRMAVDEEVGKLRRENEELRAELAVLRGGQAAPVGRSPRMISFPAEAVITPPAAPPVAMVAETPVAQPAPRSAAQLPPPAARPAQAAAAPPTKGAVAAAPGKAPATGRTHTVAPKETLYSIARRYNVKVEDIVAANAATVPKASAPLRVGAVLRIP